MRGPLWMRMLKRVLVLAWPASSPRFEHPESISLQVANKVHL
jgi:hypothetical protein